MDYELAKQLKDAGFPQNKKMGALYHDRSDYIRIGDQYYDGEWCPTNTWEVFIPTLSELIEACGSKFAALQIGPDLMWSAKGSGIEIFGQENPTDAVAKLWLELNKK